MTYLGAVPVMVSYHLPSSTLDVFAQRLESSFIIYDQETMERVTGMSEKETTRPISVRELVLADRMEVVETLLPEDVIQYMTHTSGTTGIPKLICHTG